MTEGTKIRDRLISRSWLATALAFLTVLIPTQALAHASDRGHVLLLPTGHYLVGGALAVAASFIALLFIRPAMLERLMSARLNLGTVDDRLRLPLSLISFSLMVVLIIAGFAGSRDPLSNPLPLTIWTLLWVGLTLLQGVLGNLWFWINPWYGPWLIVSTSYRHAGKISLPKHLPEWAGMWPAVITLVAFAWFELIYPAPDDPERLARAVGIYWLANFGLMLLYGHQAWSARGEFLSVFFGIVSRFSIFERKSDGTLSLCLPGTKLMTVSPLPPSGTVFVLFALASVSFDGLSKTFFYFSLNDLNPLEFPGRTALMETNSIGLMATCLLLAALFFVCVLSGERLVRGSKGLTVASGTLVWSIVPIALAYHFSHYLTVLLVNSQYALVAFSDPFSLGWDLLGTAHMPVMAAIATGSEGAWLVWNAQAAAIVGGHVIAVIAAHLLAARLHPSPRQAAISQLPLTALMIAYTVFGLWLLSTPTAA